MVDHKKFADHRTSLYLVDPAKIVVVPGLNARDLTTPENVEHIRSIAESIRINGFLESHPLEVTAVNEAFELTAGHCRLAAVMLLRAEGHVIEFVPYVPEKKGTDDVERLINQRVSNSGKPLAPLEEGYNVKRLMALGLSVEEVAKRTGRSGTYIDNLLALQGAPTDVKDMVKAGEISAKLAVKTIQQEGSTEGAATLRETVDAVKAVGRKKATPKDVQARAEAKDTERKFRMRFSPKTELLGVRIGNVEFKFAPAIWLDIAGKIAGEARKHVEGGDVDKGEPPSVDVAAALAKIEAPASEIVL